MRRLKDEGYVPLNDSRYFGLLKEVEELELLKQLAKFPLEIVEAVKANSPSKICRFAIDLATVFHKFYVNVKIKGQKEELVVARLCLCEAVRLTLKNAFNILKIEAAAEV